MSADLLAFIRRAVTELDLYYIAGYLDVSPHVLSFMVGRRTKCYAEQSCGTVAMKFAAHRPTLELMMKKGRTRYIGIQGVKPNERE
jgi:hypothetical protein